jgi:AraC family transcriptional regulator
LQPCAGKGQAKIVRTIDVCSTHPHWRTCCVSRKIGTAGQAAHGRLSCMKPEAARESTRLDYQERILRVLVHLERHLDDPLQLEQLADLAGYSPCHFHRIFTGMVGESVAEHVRRLRIERAALMLRDRRFSVLRIALDAGYQDHSSFSRTFREHFACTPSAWRRRPRRVPLSDDPRRHLVSTFTGTITMDIRIRTLDQLRVAFVRHVGPYQECAPAWQTLAAWAGPRGLHNDSAICLGVGHDDPAVTEPSRIRYDACIVIADDMQVDGGIGVQVLPGGEHAVAIHRGPCDLLPGVYSEIIGRWIPSQGRRISRGGSPYEIYRNDMRTTPAKDLIIEICVPLE